ncbi:MAG: ABC transporter permease, partial [Chloroflexota bacterium]|nr:ABC transporter permease [Chloroflexota bacterium]
MESARRRMIEDTRSRRWSRAVTSFIRQRPLGAAGAALIIVMILAAVFADVIAPYHPEQSEFLELL